MYMYICMYMYMYMCNIYVYVGWSFMDIGGSLQHRDQPSAVWELGYDRGG